MGLRYRWFGCIRGSVHRFDTLPVALHSGTRHCSLHCQPWLLSSGGRQNAETLVHKICMYYMQGPQWSHSEVITLGDSFALHYVYSDMFNNWIHLLPVTSLLHQPLEKMHQLLVLNVSRHSERTIRARSGPSVVVSSVPNFIPWLGLALAAWDIKSVRKHFNVFVLLWNMQYN